jgi:GNAT superfamily N-acetyltransferase
MMADRPGQGASGSIEAYDLRGGPIEPFDAAGVRFVRYHAALAQSLADAMHVPVDNVFERRAMAADASLALLEDDSIAGYGWVSHDTIRIYELKLAVPIPRGHAYIWDCATLPPYRGRGIFSGLLRFLLEDLRLQGDIQAWGAVAPGNEPSLHAFSRAGFRLAGRAGLGVGLFEVTPTAEATPDEVALIRSLHAITE